MKQWDFDLVALHGPQEMTTEDRAYRGSRYDDVRKAIYANPYRGGTSGQQPGPLPMFKSTIRNAWRGALFGENKFRQASARAVDSRADLRWGTNGKGWRRIIAPNGICALGNWEITAENLYSGYFRKGSKGLTIGRFSSDGNETKRGQRRSIRKPGDAEPTGVMEFDISVSSYGRKSGLQGLSRVTVTDWQRIGKLRFTEAVASYNADHVVQFHHPGWRDDRNDPSTYVRVNEERVRR
jgi:hypothetical protein